MSKIVPITGKFTTFTSLVASAMADERAKRGFVVFFEDDGTMHFGELGVTRSDTCMATAHFTMLAVDSMRAHDDGKT